MLDRNHVVRRLRSVPGDTNSLRVERKRISRDAATLGGKEILDLAHDLIAVRIPRWIAYELILHHKHTMESITPSAVEQLGKGMSHWGEVDSFACFIAGPAWRAGRIPNSLVRAWTRSEDWCWRRAALVATVPLKSRAQGGDGDAKRTLAVCRLLVADRADLVAKAMSWSLRELAKRDPGSVRAFLSTYRDKLAPRVIREVTNKLTTGLKNPRSSA